MGTISEQLITWKEEIDGYINQLNVEVEGPHIWDNYQRVVAIMIRVTAIRTEVAWLEINGEATAADKKFRTMILDPLIDRLKEIAAFESRKMTGKKIEAEMER